ncbi:hypothetical protein BJ166DRAFT_530178 [Pestalotiopsis sp. NC0098]|nr:hypothetical protein BJ166DRAFT_530178 [Pestalotiopsis sp. NC0098]
MIEANAIILYCTHNMWFFIPLPLPLLWEEAGPRAIRNGGRSLKSIFQFPASSRVQFHKSALFLIIANTLLVTSLVVAVSRSYCSAACRSFLVQPPTTFVRYIKSVPRYTVSSDKQHNHC